MKKASALYSLRIFDKELLTFRLADRGGLVGFVSELLSVREESRHLLPLDLECTDEGLLQWLRRRLIPKGRAYADQILHALGLSRWDIKGILDASMLLSLNDSYWVVPEGFAGTFAEYSLYENCFSEELAEAALTGTGSHKVSIRTTPERTTHGRLPKVWRFLDGDGICLYKGGTCGAPNLGREPLCEYYAAQIAEAMGLSAVPYDLTHWHGITVSACPLFTDQNTSYIPIGRLVRSGSLSKCLDFYDNLGPAFHDQIRSMLVFDALIYNEDRHFGNFGVLRDNHTGEITAPAPIFDNGLSLLCYSNPDDIGNLKRLQQYAGDRTPPYCSSFETVCSAVMEDTQREQLRRMAGFTFKRHTSINFPAEHLRALEQLLELRVQQLLELPAV